MVFMKGSCALLKQRRYTRVTICDLRLLIVMVCTSLILLNCYSRPPVCHIMTLLMISIDASRPSTNFGIHRVGVQITRNPNLGWRTTLTFYQLSPPGNTYQTTLISSNGKLDLGHRPPPTPRPDSNITNLTILQWNAFHMNRMKLAELDNLANEHHCDILAVSEVHPKDKPRQLPRLPGFEEPYMKSPTGSKGLAIYVRTGIYYDIPDDFVTQMNQQSPKVIFQAINITLPDRPKPLLVMNIYVHPDTSMDDRRTFWTMLERRINITDDFIIVGDLNEGCSILSPLHSRSTYSFSDLHHNLDAFIVNDGSPTYLKLYDDRPPRLSALDVTMVSSDMGELVTSWTVLECLDSDHFPVVTSFDISINTPEPSKTISKVDWKGARSHIRSLLEDTDDSEKPSRLLQIISESIDQFTHTESAPSNKICPWWDDELDSIRRLKNKLRNTKKYEEYRKVKREQRRLFRLKKKQYRKDLLKTISEDSNPFKILRILSPKTKMSNRRHHLRLDPATRIRKVNQLADEYESLLNLNPDRHIPDYILEVRDGSEVTFKYHELFAALKHANKMSSPGDDHTTYRHLQRLIEDRDIASTLLWTFGQWTKHGLPDEATLAKIIPIPKGPSSDDGYRPISLLNCIPKVFERILTSKISAYVDHQIPMNQCGCRRKLSTTHCLLRLLNASVKADHSRKHFGAVFLDFSKAYDRVDHHRLLLKLKRKHQVPEALVRAVGLWLDQRQFYVQLDTQRSSTRPMTNGLPQGSSLSVLLWHIYVSDMPVDPNTSALFMDDTVIWAEADTPYELRMKLQAKINRISFWCKVMKVKINTLKTKVMLNEDPLNFRITIGTDSITPSTEVKYLGVTLRATTITSGPFEINLRPVADDLRRRCRVLKPLRRHVSSKEYRMFAQGLILSKLRYYLPVLAGESEETLRPLRAAYNECLLLICGGVKTTPIPLRHSQTGLPTLDTLIYQASMNEVKRIIEYPDTLMAQDRLTYDGEPGSPYVGMVRASTQLPPQLSETSFERLHDVGPSRLEVINKVEFNILSTRKLAKIHHEMNSLIPNSDLYLFTDGSYQPATRTDPPSSGAGAIIMNSDLTQVLQQSARRVIPPCHSYHSEVHAMILGLDLILSYIRFHGSPRQLTILTDSRSLLTHLESISTQLRPLVYDSIEAIIDKLVTLSTHTKIKMIWIPGHIGIEGNEYADNMANSGRSSGLVMGDKYPISILRHHIRGVVDDELHHYLDENVKNSSLWDDSPDREHFKTPMNSPKMNVRRLRQTDVSLFRLFSGHTNTRDHWIRIGIEVDDDKCRYCKTSKETAEHLVMECQVIWKGNESIVDDLVNTYRSEMDESATLRKVLEHREGPIFDKLKRTIDELVIRGVVL